MTGTVEFIQRITYVEIPDEKGKMQVYAIPETAENERELVRCKDCKHIQSDGWCKYYRHSEKEDWFCADGERKE